jgi:hypothetical protein
MSKVFYQNALNALKKSQQEASPKNGREKWF